MIPFLSFSTGRVAGKFLTGLLCFAAVASGEAAVQRFYLQWQRPDAAHPWLQHVDVAIFSGDGHLEQRAIAEAEGEYPLGLEGELTLPDDAKEPVWVQVRLAGGYGFTVSSAQLAEQPYFWVKDLGVYLSGQETWTQSQPQRAAAARTIEASLQKPFVSCSEAYFTWTGQTEHEPDDIHKPFWDFFAAKQTWPITARSTEHIKHMPEVDVGYFTARVPDLKFHPMFLGWPEHNDQFTVTETGRIGVSSQSVGGNPSKFPDIPWHPRARPYTLQFGVGVSPTLRFREPGDETVRQSLIDGHRLMVASEWSDAGVRMVQTTFACPLEGEQIRTGLEPLLAWSRLEVTNLESVDRDVYVGLRCTDEERLTFMDRLENPAVAEFAWREGNLLSGGDVVALADPALVFARTPVAKGSEFSAPVRLKAGESRTFWMANFYRPVPAARAAEVRTLGYEGARARMTGYWDRIAAEGAAISVPEPWFNNLYRTFLPRVLINAHLDPQGMAVLHTSPIIYSRVWHHVSALGAVGDLARRGQFERTKRYLEPFFIWQGIPAPDSPAIKDWTGFFGAPPEQCPKVWISFQGRILWAAARYYQLSGDRPWLDEKLPALLKGLAWARTARRQTMQLRPDGTRPFDYGWLPPGRAGDSVSGTSLMSDGNMWLGMETLTHVLEQIGHPAAAEWRAETDDYHQCLIDGERRASAARPLVRLNDGTWGPYMPAFLDTTGIETMHKYVNFADGPWGMGVFDTGVFAGLPEQHWLVQQFEDNFTPLNPALNDEPFTQAGMQDYLERDEVKNFLYSFYSQSVNTLARETLTTFEHRSWGLKRVYELTPWAAGGWITAYTDMLCRTAGTELWLLQATPRRWLEDGREISVQRLQTEFGPVSFHVRSQLAEKTIKAEIQAPERLAPTRFRLRLRVPDGHTLKTVTINGQPTRDFDATGGWINLPAKGNSRVVASY